jgi:antitoxin CcdA
MKHDPMPVSKRKPVNLTLDTGVVKAARELGLNLSQICEAGLREATKKEQDRRWQEENREWIEAHRRWVESNPLPLEKLRLF